MKQLKIDKFRCRKCGDVLDGAEFAQTHSMINGHWCDALPVLPLEYEDA
ncbi:MAG: hypothetical protein KAJ03_01595 [Gammaproteobacteria bacterium]|nr:hypothetical protein [Gammaproteobacteria bacterium]